MTKNISSTSRRLSRPAIIVISLMILSGCNMLTRLSEVGDGPKIAPIANPTTAVDYRPVSMPMPAPKRVTWNPNSLWRSGARAFFRDQRANDVGDILTISLDISDSADLENKTTRKRADTEDGDVTNFLGLEGELSKLLPQAINPASTLSLGSAQDTSGDGAIDRNETIKVTIAAIITQILPNGNLVVFGRQQVKVNFELREVIITGIIRPEDIDYTNTIAHDKIAELRVSYGGRGSLSDLQQPRYGMQIIDILFPF